jgi:predicted  nucleic acid-binding Zn-ribbon protein
MDINPGGIRLIESKFNVTDLVELQLIENAISARSTEIENIKNNKEQVSSQEELKKATGRFDEANGVYADLESKRKKLEDTVEMQNEKIKNDEKKLFSGTIMSAKELENYQEEVKILKQKNSEIEDKILELMIELEEMSDKVKLAAAEKDKAESNVNRINNEMNEKIEVLKHIVEGLRKRKDDVISRIPKDHLKRYNEVKNKKGGIAVSVLKNNFCNVCNMEIPTIAAEKIEDMDEIYSCPLCGRIAVIYRSEIDAIKKELES